VLKRRALGLVYVLLLFGVLSVFLCALFFRVHQSLAVVHFDLPTLQARRLCSLGLQTGLLLMRDEVDFYKPGWQVISTSLGPGFEASQLGGTFQLDFRDASDFSSPTPYPATGSYRTMQCSARVGSRVARGAVTVKLGCPLLDYLFLSQGGGLLGFGYNASVTTQGPIFVNSDPSRPHSGDLWLLHDSQAYDSLNGHWSTASTNLNISGILQAYGDVYLKGSNEDPRWDVENPGQPRYFKDALTLEGEFPAGTRYQQVDFAAKDAPIAGQVLFSQDSRVQSQAVMNLKVPNAASIFAKIRAHSGESNVVTVDLNGVGEDGVLLEFLNGKAYLSRAERRTVGRCYDRSFLLDASTTNLFSLGTDITQMRREVAWDDPDYADEAVYALPPELRTGSLGFDPAGTADYFEVKRLVRGASLHDPIDLNRSSWTALYLTTSDVGVAYADAPVAGDGGPPVYVRGVVSGKVVVYYDDLTDHDDRLGMFTLCQHEDAGDRAAAAYPIDVDGDATRPGVPGGVHYADARLKTSPDQSGGLSDDLLVLVCRGIFNGVGDSGTHKAAIYPHPGGARLDYRAYLENLDRAVSQKYSGRPDDDEYRLNRLPTVDLGNEVLCPFSGAVVATQIWGEWGRLSADARLAKSVFTRHYYRLDSVPFIWSIFAGQAPAWSNPSARAIFPRNMRAAETTSGCIQRLRGALQSTTNRFSFVGDGQYDYRLRDLDSQVVDKEMKLPLSVEVATWQNQ